LHKQPKTIKLRQTAKGVEVYREDGKQAHTFPEAAMALEYIDMEARHKDEITNACLEKVTFFRLQAIVNRHIAERKDILSKVCRN